MSKEYVLASSGFVIPSNRLFIEVDKDSTYKESVLGKMDSLGKDKTLSRLVEDGGVYSSPVCNETYLRYQDDPKSFDNYIAMVDILAEVFTEVDFKDFIRIQANNTFLSPLGFKLISDLVRYELGTTYKDYLVATSFFKLPQTGQVSNKEIASRQELVEAIFKDNRNWKAVNVLSDLMGNKPALAAFFKFMLTDSNRGGSYG